MHLPNDLPDMSKTDQTQYHGGTFADEIAALASLILGIRMKAWLIGSQESSPIR